MNSNIEQLIATKRLKLKCTEATNKLSCNGCGTLLSESDLIENSCPMCNDTSFKWVCVRCKGDFKEPSLGSEHPCRSVDMFFVTGHIAYEAIDAEENDGNRSKEQNLEVEPLIEILVPIADVKAEMPSVDLTKTMAAIDAVLPPPSIIIPNLNSYPKSSALPVWESAVIDIIKPRAKSADVYSSKLPYIRYAIYVLASYAMIRYFLLPESGSDVLYQRLNAQGVPILFLIFIYIKVYIKCRIIGIKKEFQSVVNNIDMATGIKGFESKKNSFRKLHDEYIKLPETETKKIEKLYPAANIKQIAEVLVRFEITSASIPGIGVERKESLLLHGIRTALDISRGQVLAIPGIGEGLADDLLAWQESCLLDYRFNPNSPDMEIEKKVVRDKIIVRKNIIECELLAGYSSLQLYKKEAVSNGEAFLPQLNIIGLKLAEAQGGVFIGKNISLKISILLSMLVVVTLLLFV